MRAFFMLTAAVGLMIAPNAEGQSGKASIRPLLDRLNEEASAFAKYAPQMQGREMLLQRTLAAPPRRPRIGEAATRPATPIWKERVIISEYGFTDVGQGLHELRQVIFMDGKRVQDDNSAQDALARLVTANGEEQKRETLRQLEKYGLRSVAADFGPLLLLFGGSGAERYEFERLGPRLLGTMPSVVYGYKQLDGVEGLTLFTGQTQRLRLEGEIWVGEGPQSAMRITMNALGVDGQVALQEEGVVDYVRGPLGGLLPSHIEHREFRDGGLIVENIFDYNSYQSLNHH